MNQDYIIVNDISLSAVIRDELKKNGIQPKYTSVLDFKKFTKEELASIKRLHLEYDSFTDISALEYCTGLKDLTIVSLNAKKASTIFSSDALYTYLSKKSRIKDFSVISKLKSLEFLTIRDDDNLTSLDLTSLDELCYLELVGNHKLAEVKGLENLKELTEIKMVNNAIESKFDLKKMLDIGLSEVELDFDLFPMILAQYPDIENDLYERARNGERVRCTWSENLSDIRFNSISTHRINIMDKKAKEILDSIIGPDYTDIEKISAIYAYLIQNVKYDYESLNAAHGEENEALKKARENHGEFTSTILDRRQSSFNAILEGKSVCEGYTNMMHYLLKSVGIKSMTVHCSEINKTEVVGYNSTHSVLKVELNGETYYFDPTWDAGKSILRNFFKTKEEFSINHVLSMTENDVQNPKQKQYTDQELSQIFNKILKDKKTGINQIRNEIKRMESSKPNKTYQEYLQEYNKKMQYLQKQYDLVVNQIEELKRKKSISPTPNHYDELNSLISKKDKINSEMLIIQEEIKNYQNKVKEERSIIHKDTILQIEKLLHIKITNEPEFIYDNILKVTRKLIKNSSMLRKEQGKISKMLEQLYYEGQLDIKTYHRMKIELLIEYDEMIKHAPKPTLQKKEQPEFRNKFKKIENLQKKELLDILKSMGIDISNIKRESEDYIKKIINQIISKQELLKEQDKIENTEGKKIF